MKLTHAQSCALDGTSIVRETLTVPLSCGENRTILALFIFSIKVFKMCALILEHPVYHSTGQVFSYAKYSQLAILNHD
jgi:hypothetical protein